MISKKIGNKKKAHFENKKFRSVNKSLYGIHVDPDNDDDNILQQRLLFTSENKTNYTSTNNNTYIPIVTWKLTKNRSHIISDISTPGRLPHSSTSQRFVLNANSPSMSEKDIGLLYRLIEGLRSSSKILRPDVLACVSYIITRMELQTNYCEDGHLSIDALFVKKI